MPNFNDSMKAKVAPAAINTGLARPAGTGSTNDLLYTLWGGTDKSINDRGNAYFNAPSGPAFRSASSTTTTSSTMTCAIPTGTAAGDILVMTIFQWFDPKSGGEASAPAGWHQRASEYSFSGDGWRWRIMTKTAGASETSVTQTGTNWYAGTMNIVAISGGSAIDVVGTYSNNLVAPSVTTTTASTLLVAVYGAARTITTGPITAPGSMTSRVTSEVFNVIGLTTNTATETLTASGATGTRTATSTATGFSQLIAIK